MNTRGWEAVTIPSTDSQLLTPPLAQEGCNHILFLPHPLTGAHCQPGQRRRSGSWGGGNGEHSLSSRLTVERDTFSKGRKTEVLRRSKPREVLGEATDAHGAVTEEPSARKPMWVPILMAGGAVLCSLASWGQEG